MRAENTSDTVGLSLNDWESLWQVWAFLLGMGVALMILGLVAIGASIPATFATMTVFGILLLIGAIFEVVTAFWGRRWRGFFLHLLTGILYLIAGVFMIENPLEAALALTLLIAACLLVGGILRVVLSVVERFDGWGWMLLNGIVSVILGVSIWRQWPLSGFWVIGLFIGIEMLFSGLSWVMLGLALRSTSKSALPT
jgi:uncharacterized membrane protein HdeD (DUF308 family)